LTTNTEGSGFSEVTSEGSRKNTNQDNSTVALEAEEAEEKAEKELRDRAGKKRQGGSRDEI
jgi:hypothetical protein